MGFLIRRVVDLTSYSVHFLSKSIPNLSTSLSAGTGVAKGPKSRVGMPATSQATRAAVQRGLWWNSAESGVNQPPLPPGRESRADCEVCAALQGSGGPVRMLLQQPLSWTGGHRLRARRGSVQPWQAEESQRALCQLDPLRV